jgi:diguanylate cyclase (GGDEF)-like protein
VPETTRILLVEDNPGDARLVKEMLREGSSKYVVTHATTVRQAIERLGTKADGVDAILLDLSLPDESGLETVRRIVSAAPLTVAVVMTGAGDEEMGHAAMQAGAQDYLVKGQVDGQRLRRALRFAMTRHRVRLELHEQSVNDDLTGLYNRRGFLQQAEQQVAAARRTRAPFLLLFLDLDRLKYVNDNFGHAEGNRAIVELGDVLRTCFRQTDTCARLGGDEFAVLAAGASAADAPAVRERLVSAIARVNAAPDRTYPLSVSIGIRPSSPTDEVSMERMLEEADSLMYEDKAKRGGKKKSRKKLKD